MSFRFDLQDAFTVISPSLHRSSSFFSQQHLGAPDEVVQQARNTATAKGYTMAVPTGKCPSCGSSASGRFCTHCGAALGTPMCPACKAPAALGSAHCNECGAHIHPTASSVPVVARNSWIIAGATATIIILTIVVWVTAAHPPTGTAAVAGTSAVGVTDLSQLSPRELAYELFDRVMRAHEQGNQSEVAKFASMAIIAHGQLGELDRDARYHVGLLYAVAGPMEMALVQADSLEVESPGHLFAAMLRGSVSRVRADTVALHRAYRSFLDNYSGEMATGKAEYQEHATSVNAFLREAQSAFPELSGT